MQRDRRLAVVGLAQRAGVLTGNTHRGAALLGKAGVVDDDDARPVDEPALHQVAVRPQDRLFVPGAVRDELLQRLHGVAMPAWHAHSLCQGLDALALAVEQQPLQVDACPVVARDALEAPR